jgi:sigma-B regulation protein RsbU (phosphoserine phosphatase)
MSAAPPTLRLVRDDELARQPSVTTPEMQLLQDEVDTLNAELTLLRRKSDMLNFHMSRLDEELRLAARLQQDFLPKALPQIGRVHFHTLFRPAGYVSGDFYDVMRLDEKHIGFYIADAVGHGVPAALLTMFIKHALATKQIIAGKGYRLLSASETITRLNETLIDQDLSAATFATAVYSTLNVETLKLTICRAGHPHPVLLRANGTIETLEPEGGLLGVFPEQRFQEISVDLASGDRLLMFTDGIEVCFSDDVTANKERWRDELNTRRQLPGKKLLEEFGELIDKENGSISPKDDLTMLVLEID